LYELHSEKKWNFFLGSESSVLLKELKVDHYFKEGYDFAFHIKNLKEK
jgi:hypothetical protein